MRTTNLYLNVLLEMESEQVITHAQMEQILDQVVDLLNAHRVPRNLMRVRVVRPVSVMDLEDHHEDQDDAGD